VLKTGRNSSVVILSDITDAGWYQVRTERNDCGTTSGWMFAAFLTPTDGGFVAAENRAGYGQPLALSTSSGSTTSAQNPTAGALLLIEPQSGGSVWQVQLPDGGTSFIRSSSVRLVG